MSDKSSIQWTDATWNPTRGCTKIAQGCKNCYAETFAERFRGVAGHPYEQGFDPRTAPGKLTEPLKWKKPRRIFVDSMSDMFHEAFSDEYIAACFGVMLGAWWHTFQVLTKRPERAAQFFTKHDAYSCVMAAREMGAGLGWPGVVIGGKVVDRSFPLPNVWVGTSIAEQKDADRNIPHLLQIPAAVRFLSVEPLIGPVNIQTIGDGAGGALTPLVGLHWQKTDIGLQVRGPRGPRIDWVIVGGESGPKARPCNVEWIRTIVEQCQSASVPVFVKQLGAKPFYPDTNGMPIKPRLKSRKGDDMAEWPEDLRIREFPRGDA